MTATVNFTVAKADNVLKVANVALRYRPSDVTPEEIQTMLRGQSSDEEKKANQSPKDSEPGYSERDRPPMSPERIRALRERMAQSGQGRPFGSTRSEWSRGRRMGRQDSENSGTKTIIARSSTSQYGINAGLKIRFPSSEKTKTRSGLLWSLDAENQLQPHRVSFGITDGRETAILNGSLKEGDIVVYESTVYPGVTEKICGPQIKKYSSLIPGKDFYLGYSPERMNPGDKVHSVDKLSLIHI